jgi:hypothetical protein
MLVRTRAVFKTGRLQYDVRDQTSTSYFILLRVSPISGHRPTVRDLETFFYSENPCLTRTSRLAKAP